MSKISATTVPALVECSYVIFITNITPLATKMATKTKPAAKLTACSRLLGTPDPNAKPVFNLRPVLVVALLVGGEIATG